MFQKCTDFSLEIDIPIKLFLMQLYDSNSVLEKLIIYDKIKIESTSSQKGWSKFEVSLLNDLSLFDMFPALSR